MQRRKRNFRICLVGLQKDSNFGDKIIFDCTKYLLEREENFDFESLYLSPKLTFFERVVRKVCAMIFGEKKAVKPLSFFYSIRFSRAVKKADKIVFVGGGIIKWRYQFFGAQISSLVRKAAQYKKQVFFNSVGVEGFSEDNFRCEILKNALNSPCIKLITSRDDINLLNSAYVPNSNAKRYFAADPAIFCSKVYNIQKKPSDVIGIGIVRKDIFTDNATDFSAGKVLQLYIALIKLLKEKCLNPMLFINGFKNDLELAHKICEATGFDFCKIQIPRSEQDLVQIISGFECVVSARLHACIISYSLGIPCIGLVWNEKLRIFGRSIGFPNRFVEAEELSAEKIFEEIQASLNSNYDEEKRRVLEESSLQSIKDISEFDFVLDKKRGI